MKRHLIAAALAIGTLSGCASVGTDYSAAAVDQLRPGMTRDQVIALMGPPNTETTLGDGRAQLGWSHARSAAFGATTSKAIFLGFDAAGRYTGVSSASAMRH